MGPPLAEGEVLSGRGRNHLEAKLEGKKKRKETNLGQAFRNILLQ